MGAKDKKSAQETPSPGSTPTTSTPASTVNSRTSTPTPSIVNGMGEKDIERPIADGKTQDDSSKLRTFLSILRRFIGVADIASARFSLPAQLLEPVPNLEYSQYGDRPELFAAIGNSDDELGRMLECLRFWFSKDLKYVRNRPCKPYNSTLGEFFRCQWTVDEAAPVLPVRSSKASSAASDASSQAPSTEDKKVKVAYLTEQTSHHPPISAYFMDCPEKGLSARGFDQLSAKFTGTSVRVTPGQYNTGIFITLHQRDNEEYRLTHPAAYLGGFLRGSLYVTVADTCYITCAKTGIKVILQYLEEGYFGKVQNRMEGVVYRCDVEADRISRVKDVPDKDILGRIEGAWTDKVYFTLGSTEFRRVSDKDRVLILDLNPLNLVPKECPPLEEQLPNESRKFWKDLTEAILAKQYSTATARKQEIEERQRARAKEREQSGTKWQPRFFVAATDPSGKPELNEEGRAVMEGLHTGNLHLEPPSEYGAM